jgi:hypothetical protein
MRHLRPARALPVLAAVLSACVPLPPPGPPAVTRGALTPEASAPAAPKAVEYNLGETTVTQARFPEDSRFRNMPVRSNGLIAVPDEGAGPFQVVLILHGTYPGYPQIDHVDRWPCDLADERPNYPGLRLPGGTPGGERVRCAVDQH